MDGIDGIPYTFTKETPRFKIAGGEKPKADGEFKKGDKVVLSAVVRDQWLPGCGRKPLVFELWYKGQIRCFDPIETGMSPEEVESYVGKLTDHSRHLCERRSNVEE